MSGEDKVRRVLRDLIGKYEKLSEKMDSSIERASMTQLVKQVDALTRLARLILTYRGVLEIEERENELTRILSEFRRESEADKTALRTVKPYGENGLCRRLAEALRELRRLKLFLLGGGGE